MKCSEQRVVIGGLHAAATSVSVVAMFCPIVAEMAIALCAADGASLIEPEEILSDIADVRSIVAVASLTCTEFVMCGVIACSIAKLASFPLRQVAVDGIASHWMKQLAEISYWQWKYSLPTQGGKQQGLPTWHQEI